MLHKSLTVPYKLYFSLNLDFISRRKQGWNSHLKLEFFTEMPQNPKSKRILVPKNVKSAIAFIVFLMTSFQLSIHAQKNDFNKRRHTIYLIFTFNDNSSKSRLNTNTSRVANNRVIALLVNGRLAVR